MRINGSETDTLRLFKLDLPREAVARFAEPASTGEWPLKYALGATTLREGFADVIDLRDLGAMTLSRYMAEAHGATGPDFHAARPQIDALTGHVVILPAQAFGGASQELTVANPLRWVGTFGEVKPTPGAGRIESDPTKGRPAGAPAPQGTGSSRPLGLIVIGVALLVLLMLALVLR
jgi:hypothetical protein